MSWQPPAGWNPALYPEILTQTDQWLSLLTFQISAAVNPNLQQVLTVGNDADGITIDNVNVIAGKAAFNIAMQPDFGSTFIVQDKAAPNSTWIEVFPANETVRIGDLDNVTDGTHIAIQTGVTVQINTPVGFTVNNIGVCTGLSVTTSSVNPTVQAGDVAATGNQTLLRIVDVNSQMTLRAVHLNLAAIAAYASDAAAGAAGLVAGDVFQTNGAGAGVFAFTGVVMVKQ